MKILYTDIDGTLVGPLGNLLWDGERSPGAHAPEALVRAARAGLAVVPLTGRSQAGVSEVARLLGLPDWIGELGGVRVYDRGAEVVVDHGEAPADLSPVADELSRGLDRLMAGFPARIEAHAPWNESRLVSLVLRGGVDVDDAEAVLAEEGLGWAQLVDNGVIPRRYDSMPDVTRVHAYHLLPRKVSKAAAIAADLTRRGIRAEDAAMVGDSAADMECAAEVGRCFLVRNGLEKDPGLAWAGGPGSGIEVTEGHFGLGFAEVVERLVGPH